MFTSYIHLKKVEFRKAVLNKSVSQVKCMSFSEKELYTNSKDYEWKENNKELVIKGVYHEVVSVKKTGEVYEVLIIADTNENELFQNYFAIQRAADKGLNDQLLSLLLLTYIQPEQTQTTKVETLCCFDYDNGIYFTESSFHLKLIKPPTFFVS